MITIIICIAIAVATFFMLNNYRLHSRDTTHELLTDVAKELNIKSSLGLISTRPSIRGEYRGFPFSIKKLEGTSNPVQIQLHVAYKFNWIGFFRISNETKISKAKKVIGIEDILIGDRQFDDTILISAQHPYHIMAILNKDLRKKVLEINDQATRFKLTHYGIEMIIDYSYSVSSTVLISHLSSLIAISKNLTDEMDIKKRLISNIKAESNADILINNIIALSRHFSLDRETLDILDQKLKHRNLKVQIEAARLLGNKGTRHLINLLKSRKLLNDNLKSNIISILGENKEIGAVPLLRSIYQTGRNGRIRSAVLSAFASIGDTKLNDFLTKELRTDDQEMQIQVISALSTCGTVDAVDTLFRLSGKSSNRKVKNAALEAVARIQARLGGAERGMLSFNETTEKEGALSVPDDAADGALSVVKAKGKKSGKKKKSRKKSKVS